MNTINVKEKSLNFFRLHDYINDKALKLCSLVKLKTLHMQDRLFAREFYYTKKNRIEIELTSYCNLKCINCDRSCRQVSTDEYMILKQIEKFIEESIKKKWRWNVIRVLGGEPTLHPKFQEVIRALKKYKDFNHYAVIEVVTNGFGDKVKSEIAKLPCWVSVDNSKKTSSQQIFGSYNIAPCDLKEYATSNFMRACSITEKCGIGFSRYGYYLCGAGASLDRVFGFDIGVKELSLNIDDLLNRQREILCKICGHFKYGVNFDRVDKELISSSWEDAYRKYMNQKPKLTLY